MSGVVAISGWLAAAVAALHGRIVLARRMELVARACHELRGPLTAARLAAQFAARGPELAGGMIPAASVRGPLQAIDLELGRARLSLADLTAARGGARAAERACTFDVGVLLVDAAEAFRPIAAQHGVRLRVEQPPGHALVHGDRARLAQACGNLLANAIEHGRRDEDEGEVVLRARAGLHTVRIEVLDDGPGLPAPVAQLVRRRPRGGRAARGRGLAIVADIAARHRGRLASAPTDRGARLVLELPTAVDG
ncbi:sensor histidine kinase KdpD [Conexibacter sp. CPCC 206217]|uniref:sensor histidine kinase n=1 Tax=Conexibacter sp. CPCC 206217 TaxID=3064574 RepID=UPI00272512C6|nr:HAMP domain-containing sensor histidine kinase [Conexibacter sp. CPCC 206217]MDO8212692.1 HAMP domain-containing sensor histidine kinase [Conexibacter sp. CPCC 206217]